MLGRKPTPRKPAGFKPALESLDGRIVPRGGSFGPPPPPDGLFGPPSGDYGGFGGTGTTSTTTTQTATKLAVQVQRTAYSGAEVQVTVIAQDQYGRPVRDYTGTVTLTSGDAAATLPAAYTFTAADHGRHTFTLTLATAGSQTVTATDGATTPLTGTGKVSVTAAPVATHFFVTTERDVYAGSPARLVVVALDAHNRPVPTYTGTVTLTSTDGSATLPAAYTFTAADRGVKAFTFTPSASGDQTLTATDAAGLTGTVGVTVADAPVAAELVVRVVPGRDGSVKVLVAAVDADGKPVSTYTGTVTLTSTDAAATLPAAYTFTAADRGVKVFDVTLPTSGKTTVTVSDAAGLTGSQEVTLPLPATNHGHRPRSR